jgi:hypothetical protein
MTKRKPPTTTVDRKTSHAENAMALEQIPSEASLPPERSKKSDKKALTPQAAAKGPARRKRKEPPTAREMLDAMFRDMNETPFTPDDYRVEVDADSLESKIGYKSLFRQMEEAVNRRVAYYRGERGGPMSEKDAWSHAFAACEDDDAVKRKFDKLMSEALEDLNFVDFMEVQTKAPRVAEGMWELLKEQARQEFASGHLGSKKVLPVGEMRSPLSVARYIGIRESFLDRSRPPSGVELALIDMLTQSFTQWHYWLEETVKRSQTPERQEEPEYSRWKEYQRQIDPKSWPGERKEGEWWRPYLSEKRAIEHAAQEAERWNRIFLRTLKQLRDLQRFAPVLINNAGQVNIAADGGQQINLSKDDDPDRQLVP